MGSVDVCRVCNSCSLHWHKGITGTNRKDKDIYFYTQDTIMVEKSGLGWKGNLGLIADPPWMLNAADRARDANEQDDQEAVGAGHADDNIYIKLDDKDILTYMQFRAQVWGAWWWSS